MRATLVLEVEFDAAKTTADAVARTLGNVLAGGARLITRCSPDLWAEYGGEPKAGQFVVAPFTHVAGPYGVELYWPIHDDADGRADTPPLTMHVAMSAYGVVVGALADDGEDSIAETMLDFHDNTLKAQVYDRGDEPVLTVEIVSDVSSERKKPSYTKGE